MHTNLYLAEKLPAARQRELLAEVDRRRLLAALAIDRSLRPSHFTSGSLDLFVAIR
jgi:hypothetical protein